ncbi:MAG: hypothetical protein QHJ73_04400, partial [Armatimonadota bacterium]|nr:hypothetical protein [Armatimonadota bacterium]
MVLWAALLLMPAWLLPVCAALPPEVAALITQAGNADDEGERFRLLKQLEAMPNLDPALKADLGKLLPVVDDWANGKQKVVVDTSRAAENGYLCRFFAGKARPAGQGELFPPAIAPDSPLYPIWCWYRGRMLIWQVIQSGPIIAVPERREAYYGEALKLLAVARQAFPRNRVLGMYLGEPIPWPKTYAPLPEAPQWA